MSEIMLKTLVMLAVLFVGYVVLAIWFTHDCRKMKKGSDRREN